MTEGFFSIDSKRPGVKYVSAWLQLAPRESTIRGHVVYSDGRPMRSFSAGLVSNSESDAERDRLIEAAARAEEARA